MLKYVNQIKESAPENSIKFLLKVDDDCYVNIKSLLKFTSVFSKYGHTIWGHILDEKSPVIRDLLRILLSNSQQSEKCPTIFIQTEKSFQMH